ncbi:serine hydrolase [Micromonospora endophytica]|uniref:serine hydrolase n=1 Tax=Micromonospora endophytica TaxID=515350 RepID=UPI0015E8CEE4|nr:serine hydrolase [Micromonospora endophytica]
MKAVRRGGTVSISGVYGGEVDPLPLMEMFDRGIQLRMGQCHVRRWTDEIVPLLTDEDPLGVSDLRTHRLPLEQAPQAYEMFHPSRVTVGHVLANLLTVSDDVAVQLCALVCPAVEVNRILVAKGFPDTAVQPVADSPRFHLGTSTARETHDLLRALVGGTLLSPASTAFVLRLLRSPVAFTDGIRRSMSSAERARIATKAGWFRDARHEAGVIFDTTGTPRLTYAFFAAGQPGADGFGATHPAVQARARLGRRLLDLTDRLGSGEPRPLRPAIHS